MPFGGLMGDSVGGYVQLYKYNGKVLDLIFIQNKENMKKYIFISFFVYMFLCCNTTRNVNHYKIYEEMYKCQGIDLKETMKPTPILSLVSPITKLVQMDYLNKLGYSSKQDTIYTLELIGEQGNYAFSVWNKDSILSYTDESCELRQTDEPLFSKYMRQLVSEWNIPEIRKEEKRNRRLSPHDKVYANRIIFNKGKFHIDCLSFYYFSNFERD